MIRNLVEDFLSDLKKQGRSKHTLINYGYSLEKLISFVENHNLNIGEINAEHLKLFRDQLVERGFKPKTVNTIVSTVKSFFEFLVEKEIISENPLYGESLRIKEARVLPKFMTERELEIFYNWLKTIPEHVALGFRTMLATGMRASEVASITPRDVIRMDNGRYLIHIKYKENRERYAPIMDIDVLKDLVRFIGDRQDDSPLFGVTNHDFKWWAQKCRRETGLNFYSYRCRHTVGTQLLKKGVPIEAVQEILGHAHIGTTRLYAAALRESVLKWAVKLDNG